MDRIPDKINIIIKRYLRVLEENKIPIERAYLFGSYANGNYNELSDIDLALISGLFEGVRIQDKNKIREITLSVSSILEVFPFRPEDFSKSNPFAKEIIETGIKVA